MSGAINRIQCAYRLIEVLAGHEFAPLRTGEVATALGIDAPRATRALQEAVAAGWVEKSADGRWRLKAGKITNISLAVQHGVQRAQSRLSDEITNYTRSPY